MVSLAATLTCPYGERLYIPAASVTAAHLPWKNTPKNVGGWNFFVT